MDVTIHRALLDRALAVDDPAGFVDIGISGDKIVEISTDELSPGHVAIQARGQLAIPPFFEPHFHLDNPLLWPSDQTADLINQSGTLFEAIDIYARVKKDRQLDDLIDKASQAVRQALSNGVLWFRGHVDIDPDSKLKMLQGVVAVKRKFSGIVDIGIIAFPQLGMARSSETVDLMYQAMENGADLVGGIPHIEKDLDDAAKQIEIIFNIAKKYNTSIDMHVDEIDDPYWRSLELLADKTIAENYQGRVSASHCCAMAAWDEATFQRIIPKVIAAQITIVTNPLTNLFLQGREDQPPVRRGVPPLDRLIKAGVNVACGHDDMNNMFYPFGSMNPLDAALFAAHAGYLTTPHLIRKAFEMPGYSAARSFGIQDYGLKVGNPAHLLLLPVQSELDALRLHPSPTLVMRAGKVLVQTEVRQTFSEIVPQ
ncbi:MAG: amidohydrolase family protein [Anaerolineales bacterium]|nr:amidohydrolase family protein [Anaerolineales bacterium]